MRRTYCFVLLLSSLSPAAAQNFELDQHRMPVAELQGQFRFCAGDDARWAAPGFDDSSWSLLRSDQSWYAQGYRGYAGVGWYRFRLTDAAHEDLALFIPMARDSYEVYANGRRIGQVGWQQGRPVPVLAVNQIFPIPRDLITAGKPVVIAVRVWRWSVLGRYYGGGFDVAPVAGESRAVAHWRDLQIHDRFWAAAGSETILAVNMVSALLALALFLLRRTEREYFWYAAAQTSWSISTITNLAPAFLVTPFLADYTGNVLASSGGTLLNFVFFHALLHERRGKIFWVGAVPMVLPLVMLVTTFAGWTTFEQMDAAGSAAFAPYAAMLLVLLIRAGRKGNVEAWLLIVPFTLSALQWVLDGLLGMVDLGKHPALNALSGYLNHLVRWPFRVGSGILIGMLCISAVCGVLILRFARSRRDEQRLAAEVEAARVVQEVLIPSQVPSVPGFHIESVYRPAGQVGGDFFQIIPRANGGALIAIGDVSGKGMPAAMTVSLLVGTFRTLAHFTESPAEMLAAMNQRMLTRSQGGFTTCLVLRVDADGTLTAANAGHIAPYVDGQEMEVANGLPLGLAAVAEYQETVARFSVKEHLTLLTDGVVEARNAQGELLGFERMRELSTMPAGQVADAAQRFGQEDDITVLTVRMASEPVAA